MLHLANVKSLRMRQIVAPVVCDPTKHNMYIHLPDAPGVNSMHLSHANRGRSRQSRSSNGTQGTMGTVPSNSSKEREESKDRNELILLMVQKSQPTTWDGAKTFVNSGVFTISIGAGCLAPTVC